MSGLVRDTFSRMQIMWKVRYESKVDVLYWGNTRYMWIRMITDHVRSHKGAFSWVLWTLLRIWVRSTLSHSLGSGQTTYSRPRKTECSDMTELACASWWRDIRNDHHWEWSELITLRPWHAHLYSRGKTYPKKHLPESFSNELEYHLASQMNLRIHCPFGRHGIDGRVRDGSLRIFSRHRRFLGFVA